ncbi:hypothetical protein ABCW44_00790 [Mannheimia haemolytica]|uniref:hypothetical protein n=1 Tax=Mannheimia haemolytica TaxID=75985 RepID=UPI003209386C
MKAQEKSEFDSFIKNEVLWYAKYLLYDESLNLMLKLVQKPKMQRNGAYQIHSVSNVVTNSDLERKLKAWANLYRFELTPALMKKALVCLKENANRISITLNKPSSVL